MRPSNRTPDQLRAVRISRHYTKHAEGSVLIEFGDTRVVCTASVEEKVPSHKKGSGEGWVTAEYGMLPRSTGPHAARSGQGQTIRTHPGNPAADRPQSARGDRPAKTRRAHHTARLRCDPGRWRHAHRQHHRRFCRAARRGEFPDEQGVAAGNAAQGFCRRHLGRYLSGQAGCSTSTTPRILPAIPT